jgi:hypothetical protein
MTADRKQLSNPFSTGSGGARFEANIQATFVALMLSGGYAPCLPSWPIVEIKLQGAVAGYATDDLIVFVENPKTNNEDIHRRITRTSTETNNEDIHHLKAEQITNPSPTTNITCKYSLNSLLCR